MYDQKAQKFRRAFEELPLGIRKEEVERLLRIVEHKPVVYLTLEGRSYKVLTVADATKILKREGVAKPDRSYITKALKGQRKTLYAFDVHVEYEENEREE